MTEDAHSIRTLRQELSATRRCYDEACATIAAMHAAAVGEVCPPKRGIVDDVADIRARMLAAEEALKLAFNRDVEAENARLAEIVADVTAQRDRALAEYQQFVSTSTAQASDYEREIETLGERVHELSAELRGTGC